MFIATDLVAHGETPNRVFSQPCKLTDRCPVQQEWINDLREPVACS